MRLKADGQSVPDGLASETPGQRDKKQHRRVKTLKEDKKQ